MSERSLSMRAYHIQTLVDDLRGLKNEAYETHREGYLPTLLWSLATDITNIDSVRWGRGVNEFQLAKAYRFNAPDSLAVLSKCRMLHERMNEIFPNVPERYTARYIVMKYIINMDYNPNTLFEDLMKQKYEVD
jgi:hypothetical protein